MGRSKAWRAINFTFMAAVALVISGCSITPDPFTAAERAARISQDRAELFKDQEEITAPITFPQALARAIKYNMDHRLRVMEEALSQNQLHKSYYGLLPELTTTAGYTSRSNQNATSSRAISTQAQSLTTSTSSERDNRTWDLSMTWNILDFGVSYFQARQEADRVLIAAERRRKVLHNLMQEVRFAFWRAVASQRVQEKVVPILDQAREALAVSRKVERERLQPPLKTLQYQRTLLEFVSQLETLQANLEVAKPELAALMNLPPGKYFDVKAPDIGKLELPKLPLSSDELEAISLLNRPELIEASYQERIGANEVRKAIARMFPGLEINGSLRYDNNSFLLNETWGKAGAQISWNLINLVSGPANIDIASSKEDLARIQRLALSIAVMSQIHVANRQFASSSKQLDRARLIADIDKRILKQIKIARKADAKGRLEVIRTAVSAVVTELNLYQVFAEAQNALGRIYATMGMDPLPEKMDSHKIDDISRVIERILQEWRRGEFALRNHVEDQDKKIVDMDEPGEDQDSLFTSFIDWIRDDSSPPQISN